VNRCLSRRLASFTGALLLAGRMASAQDKGPVVLVDREAPHADGLHLALAIGVNEFRDSHWPSLRYAGNDAEQIAALLDEQGQYASTVVTGAQVSRQRVLDALDELSATNRHKSDTVVVYVSTHGTLARDIDGSLSQVLVLSDTDHEAPSDTGLRLADVIQRFERLVSQRKVLVLATCYSGAGKSSLSQSVKTYLSGLKSAPVQPLYEVSSASIILSASTWGETAREDESLGHDIYTHFMMQALLGYDPDEDGATSVTEAHDFARQRTYEFTHGKQRPTALMTVEGDDPIVLAGARTQTGKPVLLAYESELDGYSVRVDGTEKGQLPGGIVVESGWRDIELSRPGQTDDTVADWRRRVFVREGERVPLARLLQTEPQRQVTVRVGGINIPEAHHGSARPFLGAIDVLGAVRDWPIDGLVVSVLGKFGFGQDNWEINQQQLDVSLLTFQARLGVGGVWNVGRFVFHLDAWGGASYVQETPPAAFYSEPIHLWSGLTGVSATTRLRLARQWTIGLTPGVFYLFGNLSGVVVETALTGTWSF